MAEMRRLLSTSPDKFSDNGKWAVGWGFTSLCDLRCPFCYSLKARNSSMNREVDFDAAKRFLVRNGDRIKAINFGTGESFLSRRFLRLLEFCKEHARDAKVAVTTNGAFANLSSDALLIAAQCINECDVSLDFGSPDLHDNWRGKRGTWRRAMKAVEMAVKHGLETSIVMVGTAQTLKAENVLSLMKISESFQVAIRMNLYMPTSGDFSFVPAVESVFMVLKMFREWSPALCSSDRLIGTIVGSFQPPPSDELRRSCRILPDGAISPSTYLLDAPWLVRREFANVELEDLLTCGPFEQYKSPPIPDICAECSVVSQCNGGSVERRWLWEHSLETADPFCPLVQKNEGYTIMPPVQESNQNKWSGPTVHLEYLPTVIALPPSTSQGGTES